MHIDDIEITLPGPFVVFQGTAGDGMMNTIDSMPQLDHFSSECNDMDLHVSNLTGRFTQYNNSDLLGEYATKSDYNVGVSFFDNAIDTLIPENVVSAASIISPYNNLSRQKLRAIELWQNECRNREVDQCNEVLLQGNPQTASGSCRNFVGRTRINNTLWWTSKKGCLLVWNTSPTLDEDGYIRLGDPIHELPPGCTVRGTEIKILDSNTLVQYNKVDNFPSSSSVQPISQQGTCQIMRIASPCEGFVLLSLDGYVFLGPGLPSLYTDPQLWLWRVTIPDGAYLREGLELASNHQDTIPFGCFVRVTRKTINAMGLSRLRIEALQQNEQGEETANVKNRVTGWISESLNPLSGQRGCIVQPISFPVPALYRVRLLDGAVIRSGIELSSQQIGHAPFGSILAVVGRAFSEHPMDKCIDRLKLAGGAGWISLRLNRHSPEDDFVVEMIDIDRSFNPYQPALYHFEKQWGSMVYALPADFMDDASDRDLPQVDDLYHESVHKIGDRNLSECKSQYTADNNTNQEAHEFVPCSRSNSIKYKKNVAEEKCLICLTDERTATIVHGETGHIACCLACARILKARGDKCPVCRLPIDSVIQQFWA